MQYGDDKIEKLEGWGQLSVENLKYSINQKKISPQKDLYLLQALDTQDQRMQNYYLNTLFHFQIFKIFQKKVIMMIY